MKYFLYFLLIFIKLESPTCQENYDQDLTYLSVLVKVNDKSIASGIFIRDSNYVYFVTAKHVVYKEQNNIFTNDLKHNILNLIFYQSNSKFKLFGELQVDMVKINAIKAMMDTTNNDIFIIKIGQIVHDNIILEQGVKMISDNLNNMQVADYNMIKLYSDINIGENIYAVGYPQTLGLKRLFQYDFNLPLVRNCIVAGKNDDLKTLIIDCTLYPGNSGCPVFITNKVSETQGNMTITRNKRYLVGIVSAFIPLVEDQKERFSGYSVVIPFDSIHKFIHSQYK
jgi:V8-like Glu-specific endopeptidase